MKSTISSLLLALLVVLTTTTSTVSAQNGYCNACRPAPANSKSQRKVSTPNKKITTAPGVTMTCGELATSVADVRIGSWAATGENRLCTVAQYIFWEKGCQCSGPSIPSPLANYKDPNPACDLCEYVPNNKGIPSVNFGLTSNTPFGIMNCKGLYDAMAEGIMDASGCVRTQAMAGNRCCTVKYSG